MRNLEKQAFILGVAAAVESEIFARVWAKTEKQDPQNFGISSELPACCLGASHSRSPPAFHSGLLKDACGRWCEVGKVSARSPNLTPYAERFVRSVKESRLERRLSSRNRCAKRLLGRPAQLLLSSRGVKPRPFHIVTLSCNNQCNPTRSSLGQIPFFVRLHYSE